MSAPSYPEQASSNQGVSGPEATSWVRRVEWIVAIALSAAVLLLLVVTTTHAGSLWRDEAETAQSARMSVAEMANNIQYTSFPILFPLSVRAYTTFFGDSDTSLRCFGLLVGIGFLVVVWFGLQRLINDVPLLLLAILGLNMGFLINGTSIRGYGLGTVLILLALVLTVRFLLDQNWQTLAWATVVYLASMHCLFFDGLLVAAIIGAAVALLLIRRTPRWCSALMVVGAGCGLIYVPYLVQFFGGKRGSAVVPLPFEPIWKHFVRAWGENIVAVSEIWIGVVALVFAGALFRLVVVWRQPTRERDLLFFGILVMPLSIVLYYAFFRFLPRKPEGRYFLALVCLLAAIADVLWANLPRPYWLRLARVGLVSAAMIGLPIVIWPSLLPAESNARLISETAQNEARAEDLIIVNPWSYGISFNWYYHGSARWLTVPELGDRRVHRYDLLVNKMASPGPLTDVEEAIASTLQSGHRVFVVGQIDMPPEGEPPMKLTPAPDPKFGWLDLAYAKAWSQQIGWLIEQHVEHPSVIVGPGQMVRDREYMMLFRLEGWKN